MFCHLVFPVRAPSKQVPCRGANDTLTPQGTSGVPQSALAWAECPGARQMDSPQLDGCPSLLPATQTEQHPDRLAENCLHKVTSIHIKPAFLFRKVNISACYSQTPSIQHAVCKRCVHMDTRKATHMLYLRSTHPGTVQSAKMFS